MNFSGPIAGLPVPKLGGIGHVVQANEKEAVASPVAPVTDSLPTAQGPIPTNPNSGEEE